MTVTMERAWEAEGLEVQCEEYTACIGAEMSAKALEHLKNNEVTGVTGVECARRNVGGRGKKSDEWTTLPILDK